MITKELGKTGENICTVGIGTWRMPNSQETIDVIQAGLKSGTNFIDTAEFYRNEQTVGKAITGNDDVFLATKVFPIHFRYNSVIKACNRSLKKLQRDTIDLYQLHWPSPRVPIAETMKAMEKLVDEGKIRYIGISNFSLKQMKEAQESMKKYEIVSNQVEYNPMVRDPETEIMDYCKKEKVSIIAYSPFKHGSALSRLSREDSIFYEISRERESTVPQIILAWLISREPVFAIPKSSSAKRVEENVKSQNISLTHEEVERIDRYVNSFNSRSTKNKVGGLISFFSWFF